jgi:hypothetical protein
MHIQMRFMKYVCDFYINCKTPEYTYLCIYLNCKLLNDLNKNRIDEINPVKKDLTIG